MPFAQVNGAGLFWEESGSGQPLVLIPGFASGAWSWAWQVPELSRSFRVITFDPRGVSRSKLDDGSTVSIEMIADDVAALINRIGLEAAHILGISFGGFAAQALAIRHPGRVEKLVLASTSFGGPNHVMPSAETLASFAETGGPNSSERIRRNLVLAFSESFANTSSGQVERFCMLRERNPVAEEVYRQQLASAMAFDAEQQCGEIKAETLVIGGDQDTVVPFQNSRNIAEQIPNARLAVITNAGHMAFIERAAEFNRLVAEFLKGQ
jgi:pimeloyl-ACP methyl ester carboxylesterase